MRWGLAVSFVQEQKRIGGEEIGSSRRRGDAERGCMGEASQGVAGWMVG